jgi:hypothetical protein
VIHILQVDGTVIVEHATMAKSTFHDFQAFLVSAVDRDYSLDLDFLGTHADDLLDLDAPFSEK